MKQETKNLGGRPKAFDRETVLDAAVLVFWEKGYEGTSLDDLTRAMGINRPSLYATFGNKHGLFLDALNRYRAVQGAAQLAPLRDEPDIRAAVAGYYRQIIRTVASPTGPCGCLIASVATEVAERDPKVREQLAAGLNAARSFIDQRLEDAVLQQTAPQSLTGALVLSAGMSLAQLSRLGTSEAELQRLADDYVRHFFDGPDQTSTGD